jgi:hypothetical protein
MHNKSNQLAFEYDKVPPQEQIHAAHQEIRISAIKESFANISKANQYLAFAAQVEKEPPLYAKRMRKNPLTGEMERYDPARLRELGEFYDQIAQLAMHKACFYCHKKIKRRCFINSIDPNIRYERGFEVWFRHTEDRKDFTLELCRDPDTVCSRFRDPG